MRKKRKMKPVTKAITAIVAVIFAISACSLDSASYLPMKVMVASMVYLVAVGIRYGIFEEVGDY